MKKMIGLLVSFVILIGLITGCSSKSEDDSPNSEDTTASESAWPKTFTDDTGNEITLEKKPERIALLHTMYLEHFLALGEVPAASAGSTTGTASKAIEEWETVKQYSEKAKDIIDLGSSREVNIEAVLEANPDVIVTFKGQVNVEKIYDQLVEIAPVVQIDFNSTWQAQTLMCAEVVGKEDEAKSLINDVEAEVSGAKEKLINIDKTVALFRTDGKSFINRADKKYYETFGVKRPAGYPDTFETMSLEAISKMNPDYIIFQDYKDTAESFIKSQQYSSVWKNLDAVKEDRVVYFDDSLNTFGPLATRLTAEKLQNILINE